ncbi:DNA-binding transcriptional regulator AraC [compost metagenome]
MENLQKLILVLLYGSLILQSFIVLVNPMNVNKKANLFFGLFLFFWSTYWILDILAICMLPVTEHAAKFVYFLQIFTPILLYASVVLFINPNRKFKKIDLCCCVIPVVYLVLLLFFWENEVCRKLALFINISQNLLYLSFIYYKIRKHQKRIETISSNTEINLQWLIKLTFLLLITITITVGYELYNIFIQKTQDNFLMDLLFLFIVYITTYYTLRQKEIYPLDEQQRKELLAVELEEEMPGEKKKLLTDAEFEVFKQRLLFLMETERPYLDGELNLIKLANQMSMNPHQLSYLINNGFNENFFQFVNKYRVERAKALLLDENENKFSLVGIAYEAGFNSKTSFNTIFKKVTHQTPSEFRKKHSTL